MKRLVAILTLVALTGCSVKDTSFHLENGVCYRTRTSKTLGIQTGKSTVQAVRENCGDANAHP